MKRKLKIISFGLTTMLTLCLLLTSIVLVPAAEAKAVNSVKAIAEKVQEEDCYLDSIVSEKHQDIAMKYCEKYDVPFELVIAVIETESGGNADVISETRDYGLMQINISNHKWLKNTLHIKNFLDPEENIKAGCYMLSRYLKAYNGNLNLTLMSYNLGGRKAETLWKEGVRNTEYSKRIISRYKELCEKN